MTQTQTSVFIVLSLAFCMLLFYVGYLGGIQDGIQEGAELEKNGHIVWTTNSVTNVTFKVKD
jgi:hypothetical protein